MMVKDLIEELKKYPENMYVIDVFSEKLRDAYEKTCNEILYDILVNMHTIKLL